MLSTVFSTLQPNTDLSQLLALVPAGVNDPTWWDNPAITRDMLPATLQTLAMAVFATLFTVIIGGPLGLLLVATGKGGLLPNLAVNRVLGFIVDFGRSVPFIILAVAIIPFTRLVAGTSLGWKAAIVPLTVAAIPFFARLVESNVMGVDPGKIEAAKMMGASRTQIMLGVQTREALPALIQSITVLMVSLVSYSAITGAFGGDGVGALAMNYGYNRHQNDTMLVAVLVCAAMVMIIQFIGDMLSRWATHRR